MQVIMLLFKVGSSKAVTILGVSQIVAENKELEKTQNEDTFSSSTRSSWGLRKLIGAILLMQEQTSGTSTGTCPSAKGSFVAPLLRAGSGAKIHASKELHGRFLPLWPVTSEPLQQTKDVYSEAAI